MSPFALQRNAARKLTLVSHALNQSATAWEACGRFSTYLPFAARLCRWRQSHGRVQCLAHPRSFRLPESRASSLAAFAAGYAFGSLIVLATRNCVESGEKKWAAVR